MNIIGIDLAKNIFHLCVMNKQGRVLRRFKATRAKLYERVLQEGTCIVAMEACGGAQYWARRFREAGYEVRIMAAQFVKPFVKTNKNDAIDAEAICEAAFRPQMRFVGIRREDQQDLQNVHRARERLVRSRTALCNEVRGLLLEYGIVVPKGVHQLRKALPLLLEEEKNNRSMLWLQTFSEFLAELHVLDERIEKCENQLSAFCRQDASCKRLLEVPGVGQIIATAIVAAVADPGTFKNGRQFAAWLGLTPRQHSTGGKQNLGRISKRGDKYLRKLLVQGARSVALAAERKKKTDRHSEWLFAIARRRGSNKAIVALANKTARIIWVLLAKNKEFKQPEALPLAA